MRPHLAAIDAALGAQSPGVAGLSSLIDKAVEAVSASRPTVPRQHVISQVVSRMLVEDVPPHGRVVARVDLATKQVQLIGTNGVGWVLDFVPVDSKATEELWQQVERDLNPAIAAALNGTALGTLRALPP